MDATSTNNNSVKRLATYSVCRKCKAATHSKLTTNPPTRILYFFMRFSSPDNRNSRLRMCFHPCNLDKDIFEGGFFTMHGNYLPLFYNFDKIGIISEIIHGEGL